jgi:hypothetical protein
MNATTDFSRSLSKIFTNPVFRVVAQSGTSDYILTKIHKYKAELFAKAGTSIKSVIENAYGHLGNNYRNEYIYKNTIINNILLGRHSLKTATLLNEFKVAGSIADTVIINGTSTVYEIKTELDNPAKLEKQLDDYRKAFVKVYLVTHHTLSDRYYTLIKNTSVGLLSLSGRFNLTTVKHASEDYEGLESDTMMKTLRKTEYSAIVQEFFGYLPNVSNIRYFSECLRLAKEIEPAILHEMMLSELKKRVPTDSQNLASPDIPREIKHLCLCIDPTASEYRNLSNFLNHNI